MSMNALDRCAGPATALVLGMALPVACGDPPDARSECVTLDAACRPLYDPPTFPVIFDRILQPTCARGMGTCHTADARMAGLSFEQADEAYALLLGEGGRARVVAGEPECSLIMQRLASPDPSFRMPPGPTPLLDSELCAVSLWIREGAAR
jgi:hypothetical protein